MNPNEFNLVGIECSPFEGDAIGGRGLSINYSEAETAFGNVLVASTAQGVCYLAFSDEPGLALKELSERYPFADYSMQADEYQNQAIKALALDVKEPVKLCLTGTPFQLEVWNELLKIPVGKLTTYGAIARALNKPKAYRAVGSAIGANPVAILIPCHRVVRSTGALGGYRWGLSRKERILQWEAALKEKMIYIH